MVKEFISDVLDYVRRVAAQLPGSLVALASFILVVVSEFLHKPVGLPVQAYLLLVVAGVALAGFLEWRDLYNRQISPEHQAKLRRVAAGGLDSLADDDPSIRYADEGRSDGILREMFSQHFSELAPQLGEWDQIGRDIPVMKEMAGERMISQVQDDISSQFSSDDGWQMPVLLDHARLHVDRLKEHMHPAEPSIGFGRLDSILWSGAVVSDIDLQNAAARERGQLAITLLGRIIADVMATWPRQELSQLSQRRNEIRDEVSHQLQLIIQGESFVPRRCSGCPRRYRSIA